MNEKFKRKELHHDRHTVSMDLLEMDGMSLRSIFLSNILMNSIERNDDDFSYRPRYYFVRGIPVTEGEQTLMLS